MKDVKKVEEGDSIIARHNNRLMIVTEVKYAHTYLNGETCVYPKPFIKAKLSHPAPGMLADGTSINLLAKWDYSAIYHKPGSTGDGLCFNERVV